MILRDFGYVSSYGLTESLQRTSCYATDLKRKSFSWAKTTKKKKKEEEEKSNLANPGVLGT